MGSNVAVGSASRSSIPLRRPQWDSGIPRRVLRVKSGGLTEDGDKCGRQRSELEMAFGSIAGLR
jgi:hypothetical protein